LAKGVERRITNQSNLRIVLSKLLTSLSETDNKLSGEQELHFLQSLLQSKEINALVNVHHKVAKLGKDDRIAPILSASMQVSERTKNYV
jgi:MAGUK p55 subfamily member 3/7